MTDISINAAIAELEYQRNIIMSRCVALAAKIAELENKIKELSPKDESEEM